MNHMIPVVISWFEVAVKNKNALYSAHEGDYDIDRKFFQLSDLKLSLKDLITIRAKGTLNLKKETPSQEFP